jgi:hypothetical protein
MVVSTKTTCFFLRTVFGRKIVMKREQMIPVTMKIVRRECWTELMQLNTTAQQLPVRANRRSNWNRTKECSSQTKAKTTTTRNNVQLL